MMDKEPNPEFINQPWLTYLFVIFFSVWGGLVNLIQRYRLAKERRFNMTETVGELTISAFAGMLVYYLCVYVNVDTSLRAGLVGIAGHMGSRIIFVLEQIIKERLSRQFNVDTTSDSGESK